jgi:hypothetical protein
MKLYEEALKILNEAKKKAPGFGDKKEQQDSEFGYIKPDIDTSTIKHLNINQIANIIYKDWLTLNYAAEPYLHTMSSLKTVDDNYGADSGRSIVAYFLANASNWKGPVAKAVKTELNKRLKSK